ncbi:MAG: hypothetical protein FWC97_10700 [Treponema sp.]|nr:hypothetical protein [Treponema sp.]
MDMNMSMREKGNFKKHLPFIVCVLVFALFLAFITLNLDNRCDISFGFVTLPAVPVFITIFTSFVLGFLCAIPFFFYMRKNKKTGKKSKSNADNLSDDNVNKI